MPEHSAWAWLVGGGLAVLATAAAGLRWFVHAIVREVIAEIVRLHNEDEFAHTRAALRNHAGMESKLDRLAERVAELHEDMARLIDSHNAAVTHGTCAVVKNRWDLGERGR